MPQIAAINYRQRVRIIGTPLRCVYQLSAPAYKTSCAGDPVPPKILVKIYLVLNHPINIPSKENVRKNELS